MLSLIKVIFVVVIVFNKPWVLILHLMEIQSNERNVEEGLAVNNVLTFHVEAGVVSINGGGKPML